MKKIKGFIYLDSNTHFTGVIESSQLVLEGSVTGEIHAKDEVLLKKGCFLKGDIKTKKILVEEGYHHDGILKFVTESNNTETVSKPAGSKDDTDPAASDLHTPETGTDVTVNETREEEESATRLW